MLDPIAEEFELFGARGADIGKRSDGIKRDRRGFGVDVELEEDFINSDSEEEYDHMRKMRGRDKNMYF